MTKVAVESNICDTISGGEVRAGFNTQGPDRQSLCDRQRKSKTVNWTLKTYSQIDTHWFQDRFVSKEIIVICISQRYITECQEHTLVS